MLKEKKMNNQEAKKKLEQYGQEHVFEYYDELSDQEKEKLIKQIQETDMEVLSLFAQKDKLQEKGKITPLAAMQLDEIEKNRQHYFNMGCSALKNGKIGAVLLAGGMGTRLGSDDPKGMYNIGITREVYIFERIIQNLFDVVEQTGSYIHLFIMTSDKNHKQTTRFLQEKNYFGYNREYITFFKQDMAPAVDYQGKILMESKSKMSTSPNGNGGWFTSIIRNGLLDEIHTKGIEFLNVFAVDNVLQKIADPVFIGAVLEKNCAVGSKVVKKTNPNENVGVMCLEDGKPSIVEYYELTDELKDAKDENGKPTYNFGVILNYLFRVKDLEKIASKKMPFHIVKKAVSYMNESGKLIKPKEPNAYKFEALVLDMIHMMDNCLPFEVVRNKEFAPIKNKTGTDSVESARALLKENGVDL